MSDASATGPAVPADPLLRPLARLLRPLVRLLIHRGVTFPTLAGLLRELYVEVAEREFALAAKSQTDSRVSLLTGIHRKEVRRLRDDGVPVHDTPASLSLSSQIVARWVGDAAYLDPRGYPLPLPRPVFEDLVAALTKDVRPRAVLDDWLDRGIASLDGDGRILLATAAYVPPAGDADTLFYFGRNLGDHVAAAAANVIGPAPAFFDRSVHYDGLTADAVAKLDALGRDAAMKLLLDLNRRAMALTADSDAAGGDRRFNLGIYLFHARDAEPGRG